MHIRDNTQTASSIIPGKYITCIYQMPLIIIYFIHLSLAILHMYILHVLYDVTLFKFFPFFSVLEFELRALHLLGSSLPLEPFP
jgi:hypothetical protein